MKNIVNIIAAILCVGLFSAASPLSKNSPPPESSSSFSQVFDTVIVSERILVDVETGDSIVESTDVQVFESSRESIEPKGKAIYGYLIDGAFGLIGYLLISWLSARYPASFKFLADPRKAVREKQNE